MELEADQIYMSESSSYLADTIKLQQRLQVPSPPLSSGAPTTMDRPPSTQLWHTVEVVGECANGTIHQPSSRVLPLHPRKELQPAGKARKANEAQCSMHNCVAAIASGSHCLGNGAATHVRILLGRAVPNKPDAAKTAKAAPACIRASPKLR
eukprot:1898123-Amphidinium_carterae.1